MKVFLPDNLQKAASNLVQNPKGYFMEDHNSFLRISFRIIKVIEIFLMVALWRGFIFMLVADNMLEFRDGIPMIFLPGGS